MTPSPSLSFIIPVRNAASDLGRCLASIRRSPVPAARYEIVVVDNGSTDASAEVATRHGAVVVARPAGRVAGLRNEGARAARGQFLAFVDADHEIPAGWLGVAADVMRDGSVAAVGALCEPPVDGNWIQRTYDSLRRHPPEAQDVTWLGSGNMVVRRAAFEAVGGFDESLETCEDVDLCWRLRQAGGRIVADPRLRNVHWGDPESLRAVFLGELWRGRDNLRVSLRHRLTPRDLVSILVPGANLTALLALAVGLVGWAWGGWLLVAAALSVLGGLTLARAVTMIRRRRDAVGLLAFAQTLVVAGTYDVARAVALVGSGRHDSRRRA